MREWPCWEFLQFSKLVMLCMGLHWKTGRILGVSSGTRDYINNRK